MELKELSELASTIITVGTPTATVLFVFSKIKNHVDELVISVKDIQKTISVLPVLALRAEQLEVKVDRMESKVANIDVRLSASENDRENIHRQLDNWAKR